MSEEVMESVETEATAETQESTQEKSFSQSDVERIVEQRLQRERKKFEKQIEGVDLTEARRLLQEKEAAEIERQKEKGEFEAILKKTVEKKDAEIQSYRNKLHSTLVEGQLLAEANRNNAVSAEQVSSLLRNNLRLAEDGHVEVLDANGSPRYNDAGDPLSVGELVSEFLTANPHFVRATPGGTGSQGKAGGSTQKPASVADMLANWDQGGKKAYAEYMKANK
jgi:hypothetical protein